VFIEKMQFLFHCPSEIRLKTKNTLFIEKMQFLFHFRAKFGFSPKIRGFGIKFFFQLTVRVKFGLSQKRRVRRFNEISFSPSEVDLNLSELDLLSPFFPSVTV